MNQKIFKPELSPKLSSLEHLRQSFVEVISTPDYKFRINLLNKETNCRIATAKIQYEEFPFNHLLVKQLKLTNEEKYANKKYGSLLIEQVNKFIKKHGQVGILKNTATSKKILYDKKTGKKLNINTIYSKAGWEYIDGKSKYMIFDPTSMNTEILKKQYSEYLKEWIVT